MAHELIDYVDADDRPVGRGPRGLAAAMGLLYRVAATVCGDRDGRVLVYRRPDGAAVFPGHYDVLVGGSVRAGESYLRAAVRELDEECGLRPATPPREIFRTRRPSPVGPCWLAVHRAEAEGPLCPDRREVAWYAFRDPQELLGGALQPFIPAGAEALRRLVALDNAGDNAGHSART